MRKYALIKEPKDAICKVMLFQSDSGCYLFLYDTVEDHQCLNDLWFEFPEDAEEYCKETYTTKENEWIYIDDPVEYCQHDFIKPIRIRGRNENNPQWGMFEELVNGAWVDVTG